MKKILLALTIVFLTSCNSLEGARTAKGTGNAKIYNKTFNIVWNNAVEVARDSSLNIVSVDKNLGQILLSTSVSWSSFGERVIIFVEKQTYTKTRVEVVSKKVFAGDFLTPDWENFILQNLDNRIIKKQ